MMKTAFNIKALNKRLVIRFFVSLFLTILLSVVAFSLISYAQTGEDIIATTTDDTAVISDDNSILGELIGIDASQPLEIVLLLTILSLAPSFLIMLTCFTRIIIVFGFMRNAMATNTTPPNQVIMGLSLFLTIFIMAPVFSEINETAYKPYKNEEITLEETVEKASVPLKNFMLKQTDNEDLEFFISISKTEVPEEGYSIEEVKEDLGMTIIIPSFIISELKRAFQMGLLLFIPFLVIDLVVASTLMSMGMMMLPPAMISLPFKILMFVLVDGWQLLIGALVNSYH